MSYCPRPDCTHPQNLENAHFCQHCGTQLLLAERYRVLKLIGSGGFGRTFLGQDEYKPSHPLCAIKQFCPQDDSAKAAALFEQEARRLEHLGHHPQIPQLYAHFTQDQEQYIVQEWVEGQNLAQELAGEGALSEEAVSQVLLDLLPVLKFIHEGLVIHRDIKPENIIRRAQSQKLVLVDFGAAKYATETALGRPGTAIGSVGYVAPEQMFGQATFASDLYSLGVTCIHLLTGVDPLELYSVEEGRWIWRKFTPQPVRESLGRILDKLLVKGTRDRYESAQQVLDALHSSNLHPKSSRLSWFCCDTLTAHTAGVQTVAFSPTGEILASGSRDRTINLWQKQDWWELDTLIGHDKTVQGLSFHPQGKWLVSASADKTVKVWDLQQGREWKTLREVGGIFGHRVALSCSPDGGFLACGGGDHSVTVWQMRPFRKVTKLKLTGLFATVDAIAWSPDSQLLVTGSSSPRLYVWSMEQQKPLWARKTACSALAVSPQGDLVATGGQDHSIILWQVKTGRILLSLKSPTDSITSLAFHPQGDLLASGDETGVIRLWDVQTGCTVGSLREHQAAVRALAFHPQGTVLASGSEDKTVKLWQALV